MSDHGNPPPPLHEHEHEHARRIAWGWWFFAALALVFLGAEHRAHLLGVLPWLALLACPLMHVFMHRGHGGHRGHRDRPHREEGE